MNAMVRVELPANLCVLAGVHREILVCVDGPVTQRSLLDSLETDYPMLQGTIRDRSNNRRRPFIRFFACQQDLSHAPPDEPLPSAVAEGKELFLVIGAIAGG